MTRTLKQRGHDLGALLIVDDEPGGQALQRDLGALSAGGVLRANSFDDARALLRGDGGPAVTCLLVEALFADGTDCRGLVATALALPRPPLVVVMSRRASRALVAELVLAGADAYLERPVNASAIASLTQTSCREVERCRRLARALVGWVGLKEAQWYLRGLMNREALARVGGSHREAARLLQVDRRYVARLADEFRGDMFGRDLDVAHRDPGDRSGVRLLPLGGTAVVGRAGTTTVGQRSSTTVGPPPVTST